MIDFAMDLCALCAVQYGFGALRPRQLLAALAALAACTRLAPLLGAPGPLVHAAAYLLCAAALAGLRRPRHAAEAALGLMCTYAAGAGLASLGGGCSPLLAPLGMFALAWVTRRRRNVRCRWNVDLYVELDGAGDCFPALIDTGNRLRDHTSGLPVLIVEAAAAPRFAAAVRLRDADGARVLPFGVLGGSGSLNCHRPDRVELRLPGRLPRRAPACLVAVYPGRIPGPARALAPPEFADACASAHGPRRSIQTKYLSRGYRHGIFQRPSIDLWTGRAIPPGIAVLHRRQRPAPAATEPRGGGGADAPGERGRYAGPRHDDRAQPPAGGLYRPQI